MAGLISYKIGIQPSFIELDGFKKTRNPLADDLNKWTLEKRPKSYKIRAFIF